MTEPTVRNNETTIPVLPCISAEATLEFFQALDFEVIYPMTRPYLDLALQWSGIDLHFGRPPAAGINPEDEDVGGCLVMVDTVARYHAAFTAAMRRRYGKVQSSGRPRITRFRPEQSRFSLIDPTCNAIILIQRDEPPELEYRGSRRFEKLAKAIDNARVFRDFKNDDRAAERTITTGFRKFGAAAPAVDRARARAALIELAIALGDRNKIEGLKAWLRAIPLTDAERAIVASELQEAASLDDWLNETDRDQ